MAGAPPAGGGAALSPPPQLPVPAQAPAAFASLFADAARDPTNGDPRRLLGPFVVDIANDAANTTTVDLRNAVTASEAQRQLFAVTVISGS